MSEGCRLFVYGVGESISRDEMEEEFGSCGTVTDAYNTGKGFAFITMGSQDEARNACDNLNGKEAFGQTIKVEVAKPKGDRGGGGFGGGRSFGGGGGRGYGGGRGDSRGSGCFKCGEEGHKSYECPQGGGGGGGGRGSGCFKCGEDGHKSYECPQGGGGGRGGGGRGSGCFKCGQDGHKSYECSQ